jgi:hypothetical protein
MAFGGREFMGGTLSLVCSAKPRPSVQKGAKGHQWWNRDVFHVEDEKGRTLCGINSSEWLTIEGREPQGIIDDHNCCGRCSRKIQDTYNLQKTENAS